MYRLPRLIEPLFVAAGWKPRSAAPRVEVSAARLAADILGEFGGLRVGETGPGAQQAASDIRFYSALCPEVSAVLSPWRGQIGDCTAFASAHNDHIILFVNEEGSYFAFTDPDERLYGLGSSFGIAMQTLRFGDSFGIPLARDS